MNATNHVQPSLSRRRVMRVEPSGDGWTVRPDPVDEFGPFVRSFDSRRVAVEYANILAEGRGWPVLAEPEQPPPEAGQ